MLDAGVGTGITGEVLTLLGYGDLIGIDVSRNMLEYARKKGVYRDLQEMELGAGSEDLPSDAFAAVVAIGVFAAGHAPPECLDELIRTTRPLSQRGSTKGRSGTVSPGAEDAPNVLPL